MNLNHVMVDLETMSSGSYAPIVSIGAVKFDPIAGELPPEGDGALFYANVDLRSSARLGKIDPDTVYWWLGQSESARRALVDPKPEPVDVVLKRFATWFKPATFVWSHGATFDAVILSNFYRELGAWAPWKYPDVRDTRTLFALAYADPHSVPELAELPGDLAKHNALGDAVRQAKAVIGAYRLVRDGAAGGAGPTMAVPVFQGRGE